MALMETLQDDFSTGTVPNATRWPVVSVPANAVITGGVLRITDTSGAYPVVQSAATYTIANSYLFAKVVPQAPFGSNSQETYLSVDKDDNNFVAIYRAGTDLGVVIREAASDRYVSIGTYNGTTMAWWRIRHNGTNWFFGYSADGSSWTETSAQTTSWSATTTMRATLMVGAWAIGDTDAVSTFDNVNLTGTTPKSGTETASGTDNAGTVVQKYTGTETGTGTDNAGTVVQKYAGTDTGTGTDNAGSVVVTDTKSGADTASGTDNAGTVVQKYAGTETGAAADDVVARVASSSDSGTAADAVSGRTAGGTETATGTDSGGSITIPKAGTDTATAVEADALKLLLSDGETFAATEGVSGKRHGDTDARTVAEGETLTNLAAVPKSGSETVSSLENFNAFHSGGFTQIPSPKEWANGDSLDHGTLNKEWRDTFNWLLRRNSPGISVYNGDGAALTYTNNVAIPLKTEEYKRGNIAHATNDTKVYVWETGWYFGLAQVGANYASVSADGLKPASVVKVNGTVASRGQTTRGTNNVAVMTHQFSLYLYSGDYVEIAIGNDWSGTLIGVSGSNAYPLLELWWRSN